MVLLPRYTSPFQFRYTMSFLAAGELSSTAPMSPPLVQQLRSLLWRQLGERLLVATGSVVFIIQYFQFRVFCAFFSFGARLLIRLGAGMIIELVHEARDPDQMPHEQPPQCYQEQERHDDTSADASDLACC